MTSLGASAKRVKPWMANALTHWMTVMKSLILLLLVMLRPVPRLLTTDIDVDIEGAVVDKA